MLRRKRMDPVSHHRVGTFEERYAVARRFGGNGLAFLALYEGWEYFAPPDNPGFRRVRTAQGLRGRLR